MKENKKYIVFSAMDYTIPSNFNCDFIGIFDNNEYKFIKEQILNYLHEDIYSGYECTDVTVSFVGNAKLYSFVNEEGDTREFICIEAKDGYNGEYIEV